MEKSSQRKRLFSHQKSLFNKPAKLGRYWLISGLFALMLVLGLPTRSFSAGPKSPTWSVTLQGTPHIPQDVWIAANGSNTSGWNSGGSICLGVLANFDGPTDTTKIFFPGDHAMLLTDVLEGGIFGVDGTPVAPGDYLAPGIEDDFRPERLFSMIPGEDYYVIVDANIVNTSEPAAFPFPKGTTVRLMFTMDYVGEGRNIVPAELWIGFDLGNGSYGYAPFINEGELMYNIRLH